MWDNSVSFQYSKVLEIFFLNHIDDVCFSTRDKRYYIKDTHLGGKIQGTQYSNAPSSVTFKYQKKLEIFFHHIDELEMRLIIQVRHSTRKKRYNVKQPLFGGNICGPKH